MSFLDKSVSLERGANGRRQRSRYQCRQIPPLVPGKTLQLTLGNDEEGKGSCDGNLAKATTRRQPHDVNANSLLVDHQLARLRRQAPSLHYLP